MRSRRVIRDILLRRGGQLVALADALQAAASITAYPR